MLKLSTQITLYLLAGLFGQCTKVTMAPEASEQIYLSADRNEASQRLSNECAFRYTIANSFGGLDENSQREAVRAGFAMWQRLCRNLNFLEFSTPERAILSIKFVSPETIQFNPVKVSAGLLRGPATVTSTLRQESNGLYSILLSNAFPWNTNTLTRAIAYHVGLLMGLATSDDAASLMSPVLQNQIAIPSKADSITVNRLYVSPCGNYLPISLKVNSLVTKTIKFDKQGTVLITASGQINVGAIVGVSTPDGRPTGFGNISLAIYDIETNMNHAALMYKINDEVSWHFCGHECSFSTAKNQSVNLTFNINDNMQSDNTGAYDVTVQYK